jgi:nicotinamidase-related amidase
MQRCLIVVDYQNDFVSGSLGFPGAEKLDTLIAEKIKKYHARNDAVIFTLDTHTKDYFKTQEGRNLAVLHCIEGTDGHKIYGETKKQRQAIDKCFLKPTFGSGDLYEYLKQTPFERIEIVGLISNICVLSNVVLAKTAQPETPIIVDADATLSHDPKLHQETLDILIGLQVRIKRRIDDKGPFYHGTKANLSIGETLTPGFKSNYGEGQSSNFVYFTSTLEAASWGAELAFGQGNSRIYIVEPTGEFEDDPNLTDKKFPGNITRSYRTQDPLKITGELTDWVGHTEEEINTMRENVKNISQKGIEAIND